jgi:hypothetical protein
MLIDLSGDRPAPIWPEGISVSCLDPEVDLQQALLVGRDAFKDRWGHVDSSEEEGLERFRHRVETDPDFDPSLWYLAREGGEIAGVCYVEPLEGTDRVSLGSDLVSCSKKQGLTSISLLVISAARGG